MKAYDLKPTYDNIINTYKKDSIGRNTDIFQFVEILDSLDDGFSIALDGNWGSGKTFFVKQVKLVMDAHNKFIKLNKECREEIIEIRNRYYDKNLFDLKPQVCVYYDAWENDNDEDPIMSLVYAIMSNVSVDFNFTDRSFVKIGTSLIEAIFGRNWEKVIESLKGTSPLDTLKERKNLEELVSEFLNTLILEKGERLIIFIDELDRCKPSYAVRLLERIKHYFAHDKITFVFSVNINELQHTVRKHYGNNFDGARYLERFFDLRVPLPAPNIQRYLQTLDFNEYSSCVFDVVCNAVIKKYHFELRELAKFLKLTERVAYKAIRGQIYFSMNSGRAIRFCIDYILPVMIGLRLHDNQQYNEFIEGKNYLPLVEIAEQNKILRFHELLADNETYDERDTTREYVTLDGKIEIVYKAIFATAYNDVNYQITVKDMTFDYRIKDELLRISGLLSLLAKLDTD